ncbi:iron-containing alcohol dehydrogenase [Acinetobacter pittii]
MKAVELIREQKIDFLMAVGGGSVIDGTKFIAAAVNYTGDTWEILETHGTENYSSFAFCECTHLSGNWFRNE